MWYIRHLDVVSLCLVTAPYCVKHIYKGWSGNRISSWRQQATTRTHSVLLFIGSWDQTSVKFRSAMKLFFFYENAFKHCRSENVILFRPGIALTLYTSYNPYTRARIVFQLEWSIHVTVLLQQAKCQFLINGLMSWSAVLNPWPLNLSHLSPLTALPSVLTIRPRPFCYKRTGISWVVPHVDQNWQHTFVAKISYNQLTWMANQFNCLHQICRTSVPVRYFGNRHNDKMAQRNPLFVSNNLTLSHNVTESTSTK